MAQYNNETDLLELHEQIQANKPKSYINQRDKELRKLMKREQHNIERLKTKFKDLQVKDGIVSEELLNIK